MIEIECLYLLYCFICGPTMEEDMKGLDHLEVS